MRIDWSTRNIHEWRLWIQKVTKSNCMQTWPFAKATRMSDQKMTRLGLILQGQKPIGMLAIQEIRLGPIHFINLYRGPLWFQVSPPKTWIQEFAQIFNQEFPRRLFRRRRWLPEWEGDDLEVQDLVGFKTRHQPYSTQWISLTQSEEVIRGQLKQKWRNSLHKAEKTKLKVKEDWRGVSLSEFIHHYEKEKSRKKYPGPRGRFVKEEYLAAVPFRESVILSAVYKGETVAAIFLLLHGQAATYRVSWTTAIGRKNNAHNLLLWSAIKLLKSQGVNWFDLGGLESCSESGVNRFKKGLGGDAMHSVGMLR